MSDFTRSLRSSSARMGAGILGQVINTFGQVAVVPLFLHYWTKVAYGEWLLLTAMPNLLWSLEGGLAGLAINRMVLSSAVGDWVGANKLFQNVFVIQMIISLLLLAFGTTFVLLVNFLPFLGISEMTRREAISVSLIMLCYMLLGWCISLLRAPYFAAERSARGYMVTNFWRLSDFLVICLILVLKGHAQQVAEGEVVVVAIWVVLAYIDIRRECPKFRFGLLHVSWNQSKTVFRDGVPLFLGQAGNAFFLQGYPLILGRTLGPLAVVNFSAIRTVTRVFLQGLLILTSSASIELTSSFAQKKWDLYLRWLKILAACVVLGGATTCVGLKFFGPQVIYLWTQGKVLVDGNLLFLFGLSVMLQAAWNLFNTLLYTANKHHLQYTLYFVITMGALVMGYFTIGHFGFNWVPVLMIAADACVLASSIFLCVRSLPEVKIGSLGCIFNPFFYLAKTEWIIGQAKRVLNS